MTMGRVKVKTAVTVGTALIVTSVLFGVLLVLPTAVDNNGAPHSYHAMGPAHHALAALDLTVSLPCTSAGTSVVLPGQSLPALATSTSFALLTGTVVIERKGTKCRSDLRIRVVDIIASEPGIHLRGIRRALGCAMGALQYHIAQLESDGEVVSVRTGNARHFFVSTFSDDARVLHLASVLRNPTVSAIVRACMDASPVTQAQIGRALSIDKSLVAHYVRSLLDADVLRIVPTFGRERPLALTDWAMTALTDLLT